MNAFVRPHRLPGHQRDPSRRQRHGAIVNVIQALDELGCTIEQIIINFQPQRGEEWALITVQPHNVGALGGYVVEERETDCGRLARYQARFMGCLVRWNRRIRGEI